MNYFESAQGEQITLARALQEIKRHGLQSEENAFLLDCWGTKSDGKTIAAQDVLVWLGY